MFDFDTQPMPKENITFTFGSNWVTEDTSEDVPTDIMMAKSFENSQEVSKTGWFNLSGSKLNSKPTRKGIYIHDGKKYVIVKNEK